MRCSKRLSPTARGELASKGGFMEEHGATALGKGKPCVRKNLMSSREKE